MNDKDAYPSNSRYSKDNKEIKSVTQAVRIARDKPLLARIFGENSAGIGEYILWDVLIPAAKDTFREIVTNGIELLLYGKESPGRSRSRLKRDRANSYVSYNSLYRDRESRKPREADRRKPAGHRFDDIVIENKAEAEAALTQLLELIDVYDVASVGDFYETVGVQADYTDQRYGWETLRDARVVRVREGYILDLPTPILLD